MAGLGGLPYFLQYQQQAQQQANQNQQAAIQRQQAQIQLQDWQQKQAQQRQQQAAQAAAGNALPQLFASGQPAAQPQGQMPPPPQPPQPGQASQPAPQAQGAPLPGQGPAPGPLPPFRPMPTTPTQAQAAPQGAIPAPPAPPVSATHQPQGGPLTLQSAIKVLQDQGLKGADLFAGLQQLTPLLDAQSKAQAAQAQQQFQHELQIATLQERHDEAVQRSKDSEASTTERAQASADSLALRAQIAQLEVATRRDIAGVTPGGAPPAAPPVQPGQPLPSAQAGGGLSSQTVDMLAQRVVGGDDKALVGFTRNKQALAAVDNRVAQILNSKGGTGTDITTAGITNAANRRGAIVNAQQAAKVDASASALTQSGGIGDQLQGAIDALDNTGIPIANKAQIAVLRQTGDPRVSTYDAAQNAVVSEVAQILGRGTLTVNSMEEARRVVGQWTTSAQAKAGLAQLRKEADTTVKASTEEVQKSAKGAVGGGSGGAIPAGWTVTEH